MTTQSLEPSTINVLLSSFPGLGLPSTLCIPVPSTSTIADLSAILSARLSSSFHNQRLILTTASNKQISATSAQPLSSLLTKPRSSTTQNVTTLNTTCAQQSQPLLLTLRLSAPLCGGKGGFGSQLRAAGGRMSSRKKNKAAADLAQLSARGTDGRRLRTVQEAKALAEYLAVKPEMEKKEKEARRKKWEAVVEAAERRTEEMLQGKGGTSKGRGDAEWLERKEEAEQKVREEVLKAMREGLLVGAAAAAAAGVVVATGEKRDGEGVEAVDEMDEDESSAEEDNDVGEGHSNSSAATTPEEAPQRKVYGWDEDDDEEDDDDDDA